MRYGVAVIDDGSTHIHAFDELAAGLQACLVALKLTAKPVQYVTHDQLCGMASQARWIVLGAIRYPQRELPADVILYNTEQVGSPWFANPYTLALYRRHEVWDYSAVNAAALARLGIHAFHVPFGWYPGNAPPAVRAVTRTQGSVLFVGTLNERRQALILELERRGLAVRVLTETYGEARDRAMDRATVLINVHYYPECAVFESARVVHAVARMLPVVTEISAGGETCEGVIEVAYEQLADEVEKLARSSAPIRRARALRAFAKLDRDLMLNSVRGAVGVVDCEQQAPCLVLSMVCRDEPRVIERALQSVVGRIDAWCISYNGSQDDTPEIIARVLGHLPGALMREAWVSYGHNRSEALRHAADYGTHALILDADEVVEEWPAHVPIHLDCDGWECTERMGELANPKVRIVRLGAPWHYQGAVHELLTYQGALVGALPQLEIRNLRDGAGSDVPAVERYRSEAEMLRAALEVDPTDTRSQFYLAQSLELAGELNESLQAYEARAAMPNGFTEEAWMSLHRIAGIYARFEPAAPLVDGAYWRAWNARRTRAEPLVALARFHRLRSSPHLALVAARIASSIPLPPGDRLFVEASAHAGGWQILDELALALHGVGQHTQAVAVGEAAVQAAPAGEQPRLLRNTAYYRESAANVQALDTHA